MTRTGGSTLPRFEPLGKHHHRAAFECRHPAFDVYLRTLALQHARKKIAASAVLLVPDDTTIVGFHTLSATRLDLGALPPVLEKHFPRFAEGVPATLIGRLAVDRRFERQGHGRSLLMNALDRALLASASIGSAFVVVRAVDARAVAFYERYGFVPFLSDARRLFLPMATIIDLIGD